MSLRDFSERRNRILFWMPLGGLGDVFIQRMLFWDVKRVYPEAEIHFAVLDNYRAVVSDHPMLSGVHCAKTVELSHFMMHYKTCIYVANKYENAHGLSCALNRSDIWGLYCGIELQRHDMQFSLDASLLRECRYELDAMKNAPGAPTVLFAPVSAVRTKTLLPDQISEVVEATRCANLVGSHSRPVKELESAGVPGVYGCNLRKWMHFIAAADYVISVDSAAFHVAGGLRKPLVGIFTFANGKTYGKHYDFVLVQRHFDDGDWECGPCYDYKSCIRTRDDLKPCLTTLTDGRISGAVRQMFERWPVSGRLPLKTL